MTRRTNGRLAGVMFLAYIAAGIADMVLFNAATRGAEGTAATLAKIAENASTVRVSLLFTLIMFVTAVGLGVTLWSLTRDVDADVAMFGLCCRVSEGVIGAVAGVRTLALLSIAGGAAKASDPGAVGAVGDLLLETGGSFTLLSASCFAIGSTCFSYLFLRARSIPVLLAWVGVVASVLLVIALPLELAGLLRGPVTQFVWLPMVLFEVPLAVWLLAKGVRPAADQL